MDASLDHTTSVTLSQLEDRLRRIEHVLLGPYPTPAVDCTAVERDGETVPWRMAELERRFDGLTSRVRVYGDVLAIYESDPGLFFPARNEGSHHAPDHLPSSVVRASVLASSAAFAATASGLAAVRDCPVPETGTSAALVGLVGRMRALEAGQRAQAREVAELRARSEAAVRLWYERGLVDASRVVADADVAMQWVERAVRRLEKRQHMEQEEQY